MDKKEFYSLIDEICELEQCTIKGNESLHDSGLMDSIAMLGLIAMLDRKFNVNLNTDELKQIGSIEHLFDYVSK